MTYFKWTPFDQGLGYNSTAHERDDLAAGLIRLRVINAELLAAAKRVIETRDEASFRDGDARQAIDRLVAAMAAAEEPTNPPEKKP